jgi:hypothetical protein
VIGGALNIEYRIKCNDMSFNLVIFSIMKDPVAAFLYEAAR